MKVHHGIAFLPAFKNAVITIGTFDGVHTGHQKIIQWMLSEAKKVNGETVIITFDTHPRKILKKDSHPVFLLNTTEEKIHLLEKTGIHHLVIIPFTTAFSQMTAEAYILDFLVKFFQPNSIIIGYDHRFGKNRDGDFRLLEEKSKDLHFRVIEIPVLMEKDAAISSTKIRNALFSGDIETANLFLNYPYFFSGLVVEGNHIGKIIGFPTANLEVDDDTKLIPTNGVYAVTIEKDGNFLKGMMNIGFRPTINGTKRMIEVNIFDFNDNLYGQTLRIALHKHLRPEQKFNSLDLLKEQLKKDQSECVDFFKPLH